MILLDAANGWTNYLGHFHPVVVHLPIGILFVAFILELVARKTGQAASLNPAILITLAAGFISAVVSCLFGWFLSMDGGYEETTLMLHQWLGISVAFFAAICWLVKKRSTHAAAPSMSYASLLVFLFILITVTGHFGGSLTHGDDYLTAGMPQPFGKLFGIREKTDTTHHVKKTIANIKEAIVYEDLVTPVLEEKCYTCHSSKKIKGGLRMDKEDLLFKGGKHGIVINPGSAEQSELMIRILLPKDDEKRMPPRDKKQITNEEIALLRWWINNGADTKKKVKELTQEPAMTTVLASFSGPAPDTVKLTPLSKVFDKNPPAAKQTAIDALTGLGVLVTPVAKNSTLLGVSCINYTAFDNSKIPLLLALADNIVWLKLDNTAVTDEGIAQLAQLKNLVQLHLAGTNTGNTGIAKLQTLTNLEYINMVNTKVNDEGLMSLSPVKSLKHIYCWNSQVTQTGIDRFKQKNASVKVEAGNGSD